MLRTRLWMGAVLIALTVGVLAFDQQLAPWYPFLFVLILALALVSGYELVRLLGPVCRLPTGLCLAAVAAVVLSNWPAHLPATGSWQPAPWPWVLGTFTAVVLSAFLWEMAAFHEPGESVVRIALLVWVAAYLGLLPSFIAQLRWLGGSAGEGSISRGTLALALAVFVPKFCDVGAYFTGRFLGRHPMTPVLSPKKTWEGLAGGLAAAVVTAVGINRLGPVLSDAAAVGFGLTVGAAGVLGDLAESLIKRDCRQKDASQVMPGFGGVLDVVDSILFAAPMAYFWLG